MVLGSVLVFSALGLFLSNESEQQQAEEAVLSIMPQIVEEIHERNEEAVEETQLSPQERENKEMPVTQIDGNNYIGFVGLPTLQQELPVMADWSYPQLKIAPCRFMGSTYSDDLVIMAHNFDKHFGSLKDLRAEDIVTFTDMDGQTIRYRVVTLDILGPDDVEDMTYGDYDLTLFTCTYGGKSRVTVRCDRAENETE